MLSTRLFFGGLNEKWPWHCEVSRGKERVLTHQIHKENDLILREGGGLVLLWDTSLQFCTEKHHGESYCIPFSKRLKQGREGATSGCNKARIFL